MPSGRSPDRVPAPAPDRGRLAAVSLATALALGLWLSRAGWVGPRYLFLVWNLGLAWIPWLAARRTAEATFLQREIAAQAHAGDWPRFVTPLESLL